nr:MAG TPA: hypothetical protein [Crassvirales sp.]
MNATADRSNGRILKNYIYANISLHKLAKILIEDWQIVDKQRFPSVYKLFSSNCPRYGAQINAFIDILDVKYYWYILYPIIKEINSEVLSEYDGYLYNEIKNSLL